MKSVPEKLISFHSLKFAKEGGGEGLKEKSYMFTVINKEKRRAGVWEIDQRGQAQQDGQPTEMVTVVSMSGRDSKWMRISVVDAKTIGGGLLRLYCNLKGREQCRQQET